MDNKHLKLNANLIVAALQKPASELTKADIIDYIVNNDIRMVNFMYPGGDGKLKTLNFVINDLDYLETILTCGERVDGSSLFSFIQAGSSDLYVLPRFRTAFVDPFAEIPTVSLSARPSSIRLLRYPPCRYSVPTSIRTATRWSRHPSTRSTRLRRPSAK